MTLTQARPPGRVNELLSGIRISDVYRALTGKEPRRAGADTWRASAIWRGGDGLNVSMNDARGVWHDFTTGEGGGMLDLVLKVKGGTRQDALRWLADHFGFPLEDRPLSAAERARWAKQQGQIEVELPKARLWCRAALALGEQVLDRLKAALADPKLPPADPGAIADLTAQLAAWRLLDDAGLVAEYRSWAQNEPHLTAGLINAAELCEAAERRALCAYLGIEQPEDRT